MSDEGRLFAYGQGRVPDCLLFGGEEVSPWETRLYGVLDRYGQQFGAVMPNRRTLARHMGCSPATLDRAKTSLKQRGLLLIKPRFEPGRGQVANDYFLLPGPLPAGAAGPLPPVPPVAPGPPHNGGPPSSPVSSPPSSPMASQIEEDYLQHSSNPSPPPPSGASRARARSGDGGGGGRFAPETPERPGAFGRGSDRPRPGPGPQPEAPSPGAAPALPPAPPAPHGRGPIPPERLAAIAADIAAAMDPPPPPELVDQAVRHTRLRLLEGGLTSPANYLDALLRRLAAERAGRAARAGPAPPAAELDDLHEQVLAVDLGAEWVHPEHPEQGWLLSDGGVLLPRFAGEWVEVHELGRAPPDVDVAAGVDVA